MKKFSTLFSAAMLAVSSAGFAQTALQEDFSSTSGTALPAGWAVKSQAPHTTGWFTATGSHSWLGTSYVCPAGNGRYAIIDDYNNATDSNDSTAIVSPIIDLTGKTGVWLTFKAVFFGVGYTNGTHTEHAWVSASNDGGTTWTVLKVINPSGDWQLNAIDLSAYSNMNNVKIGFFYSDDKYGKLLGAAVDDIKVYIPPTNEMALTAVTPYNTKLASYGAVNSTKTIGGEVFNNGGAPITSFKAHYQLGTNLVVTDVITGVNIAPFTSGTFTSPTSLAIPATMGEYPLTMWVELTGDATAGNDTAKATATSVAYLPTKRMLFEEGTGAWCGWCPRGAVYMDSIAHTYPGKVSLVAVHDNSSTGDPMAIPAYDNFISPKIGGYPNVLVDRGTVVDPSLLFNVYDAQKDYFGFADLTLTDMGAPSFDLSVKVSVKPALDLSGDYRLALVLTEDDVNNSDASYDQHNYYSGYAPLKGAGHDWYAAGATVPGSQMYYQFVARAIIPTPTGAPGSLPATMTANSSYDYTFTTTVPQPFHRSNMHIVAMIINNADGSVLNSKDMVMPLGISNIAAGVQHLSVYPNPATDVTHIAFNLDERAKVSVQVVNPLGQVVSSISEQQYEKGAQQINVNTANLAAGIYTIKLSTEKGSLTQQLSVVK